MRASAVRARRGGATPASTAKLQRVLARRGAGLPLRCQVRSRSWPWARRSRAVEAAAPHFVASVKASTRTRGPPDTEICYEHRQMRRLLGQPSLLAARLTPRPLEGNSYRRAKCDCGSRPDDGAAGAGRNPACQCPPPARAGRRAGGAGKAVFGRRRLGPARCGRPAALGPSARAARRRLPHR